MDPTVFVFQVPLNPGNWSDPRSFLATISQPEVDSPSTLVSEISVFEPRNSTIATIAMVLDVTNTSTSRSGIISNQTALFEKNTRSQQDQCWETYVGQVLSFDCYTIYFFTWHVLCLSSTGSWSTENKVTQILMSV